MSKRVVVTTIPDCDFHKQQGEQRRAYMDGKTDMGPWANMCRDCAEVHAVGIGTGFGQLFIEGRICPTCKELVEINRDETLRRHKGKTPFDVATDGICSGSNCLVG